METQARQEDDQLLDERETAKILAVTVGTLQVWRSTKRYPLPYVKVGRAVRYPRSAVMAFIAARTVNGATSEAL